MAKRVVFSWIFPVDVLGGGIERVTRRLMDGLSKRGHDCLYLQHDVETSRFIFNGDDIGDLCEFLDNQNIDVLVNLNGYSSMMTDAISRAQWSGHYIVCHHNEPMYLRKIYGLRRVIAEVRAGENSLGARLAWLARLISYPLWQKLSIRRIAETQARNYWRANRYVVLSPSFLPQLKWLIKKPDLSKAVAIPNPLSFEISPEEAEQLPKKNEVLIVARLYDAEKRISAALAAWQIIETQDQEGWKLKIVGDGPDAQFLQQRARALGLERVEFLGQQDPMSHYKSASIFLMTSRVEGWGLTLTEAMQHRAVPIAFDAYASLRDIVEDGENGIIVANSDVAAFAEQTVQLMRDTERRKSLAAKALASSQSYGLDLVLDRWETIL